MAKITSLAELTDVASDDLLVVVDKSDTSMADSGTDKKVQKSNLLKGLTVSNLASGVLDTDLSSVSASDDTVPSAKATKAYVDAGKTGGFYSGYLTAEASTTTSAQVGSASVTVTTKGGNLLIIGTCPVKTSSATSGIVLAFDGSDISGTGVLTNSTTYVSLTTTCVKTSVSAGSHTVTMKFYAQGGGHTATIAAYWGYSLLVAEL